MNCIHSWCEYDYSEISVSAPKPNEVPVEELPVNSGQCWVAAQHESDMSVDAPKVESPDGPTRTVRPKPAPNAASFEPTPRMTVPRQEIFAPPVSAKLQPVVTSKNSSSLGRELPFAESSVESGDSIGADVEPSYTSDVRQFRYHEVLNNKYQLERSIARGGMGWVFLATQIPLGREVALKILMPHPGDAAFHQRFLLEASTCSKLSHPNIVTVHDYGETPEGDVFMAMEYLEGLSLSQTLNQEKCIAPLRAVHITLQIARALRAAHRAGVIHRDLKPSNVMLIRDHDGTRTRDLVKVVDFGLAKLLEVAKTPDSPELTREGILLGSPRYMAPEQIRNRNIDVRTDIYALGVLTYFILTGRPPFDADNSTDILTQHLRDQPPRMSSVNPYLRIPEPLEQLVARCLAKTPEHRYQSAEELILDLKEAERELTANGKAEELVSKPAASASKNDDAFAESNLISGGAVANQSFGLPPPRVSDTSGHLSRIALTGSHTFTSQMNELDRDQYNSEFWWALAIVLMSIIGTLSFWAFILG